MTLAEDSYNIIKRHEVILKRCLCSKDEGEAEESLKQLHNLEPVFEDDPNNRQFRYGRLLGYLIANEVLVNVRYLPTVLDIMRQKYDVTPDREETSVMLRISASSFRNQWCLSQILSRIANAPQSDNLKYGIIIVLERMQLPEDKPQDLKKFYRELDEIGEFLRRLCEHEDCTMDCLSQLYDIISERCARNEPSPALVVVLQLLNESLLNALIKKVKCQAQTNEKFLQMLTTLLQWLVKLHPKYKYMVLKLVKKFVKDMQQEERSQLAAQALPKIFARWLHNLDESTSDETSLILQLVVSIRLAKVYHKLSRELADHVRRDKKRGSNDQKNDTIEKIENFLSFVMRFVANDDHTPSTCRECKSYLTKMQEWKLDRDKKVKTSINILGQSRKNVTLVEAQSGSFYHSNPGTSYGSQQHHNSPEKSPISGSLEWYKPSTSRQATNSKVGLVNLGNTCYMNSVLQALGMTRQFCNEVLLYKSPNELNDQVVLKKLQNLFALLKYTHKTSLQPTEILHVSRPSYFMPGHQQDSSEFLCHLLDVLFEQEKSSLSSCGNSEKPEIEKPKQSAEKPMEGIEEDSPLQTSPMEDEPANGIKRWTTEENLSEETSLNRKTQSLAEFPTQGEELAQSTQQLSDSHSDSTDSGIQSVGAEDSAVQSSLIHRVFGGEMKITYECLQCHTRSDNTDKFRDLQLCFVEDQPDLREVQGLLNHYFQPEALSGENMYRCDKCAQLCEANRKSTILQAPAHLILTLKHFRYDSGTRLRTKLRNKVIHNETIELPTDNLPETYRLYAAVVHSGYSMDYGHYFTYACDSKRIWYKFNDSYVSDATFEDFERLEPPDTPYILFYKKCVPSDPNEGEDVPPLASLGRTLQEHVEEVTGHSIEYASKTNGPTFVTPTPPFRKNESDDEDEDPSDDNNAQRNGELQRPGNDSLTTKIV